METEVTNSGTPETNTAELHEASDADLDAFLLMGQPEETEQQEDEKPETVEFKQAPAAQEQTDGKQEPEKQDAQAQAPVSRQEYEKLLERLKQQEHFIQRRSNEIGEYRKQLKEANQRLKDGLQEKYIEDPMAATEQTLQIKKNEAAINELDAEENDMVQTHQSQALVFSQVAPEDFDLDGMAGILERDKIDPNFLKTFRADPFRNMNPGTLVQLAGRLKAEKVLKQLMAFTQEKMGELETLKATAKNGPRDAVRKIEQVARQTPSVNSASGNAVPRKPKKVSLESMSDTELDELLLSNS